MSFRFQRPFRIIPRLRVNFSESGASTIGDRGAWSTIRPLAGTSTTGGLPSTVLSCVIVERNHNPARALGVVLLIVVLAALAFVVAAQG